MRIDFKSLKHLTVETLSGTLLGHIFDIEMEVESHLVTTYKVKASLLRGREYLISRTQVVKITGEKMIVDDAVVEDMAQALSQEKEGGINPEPVVMSDRVVT
jgi:sporulation protein YlmC with PRC-barrel domain